jgi:hypothetical protein
LGELGAASDGASETSTVRSLFARRLAVLHTAGHHDCIGPPTGRLQELDSF